MLEVIQGRIQKNFKHRLKWARKKNIEAFRLYEKDIPDYPFIIDLYKDSAVIYFKGNDKIDLQKNHLPNLLAALKNVTNIDDDHIFYKKRFIQTEEQKYFKEQGEPNFFTIRESSLNFEVCLNKYLDTGLFLDHRPLRKELRSQQARKVLNLFCYTGSLSVAAFKNNHVTSVDLSNTYLEWAKRNFIRNGIKPEEHLFIKADVFKFLSDCNAKYDLIILDPPTFSQSKSTENVLDIQRDHIELINNCMKLLYNEGTLYFSNNLRSFKLDKSIEENFRVKDKSISSIPEDFRDKKIHKLYVIHHRV